MRRPRALLAPVAVLALAASALAATPATAKAKAAKPVVTRLSATSGTSEGGATLTITGRHFTKHSTVYFGKVQGRNVTVRGTRKITVKTPLHVHGTVNVRVKTSRGKSATKTADRYTFVRELSVVAGRELQVKAGKATAYPLGAEAVAVDAAGNRYIADQNNRVVEKVTPAGVLSVVAGEPGKAGLPHNGKATSTELSDPNALAVDTHGNLYIADQDAHVVAKVTPGGTLSIIAGEAGQSGNPTTGGLATQTTLDEPNGIAVDASGNVYFADWGAEAVLEIAASTGDLSVVAGEIGTAGSPTIGADAPSTTLDGPTDVALAPNGDIYIADAGNQAVVKVDPDNSIGLIAGEINSGTGVAVTDQAPATATPIGYPQGIAVDAVGDLYIANSANDLLEKVSPNTVPGTLSIVPTPGIASMSRVAVGPDGSVYVADPQDTRVEKITPGGTVSVAAGEAYVPPAPGAATSRWIDADAVAVDAKGELFIDDGGADVVERVTPAGVLSVYAGEEGKYAPPVSGAKATHSGLESVQGLAVDAKGNLYIADDDACVVEKVSTTDVTTIVAGKTGDCATPVSGTKATQTTLDDPRAVAVDAKGDLYIADGDADVIEKISTAGVLSIAAGRIGSHALPVSGQKATETSLEYPDGIAVDTKGNLYIADSDANQLDKVNTKGVLTVIAGSKTGASGRPKPGKATSSPLDEPEDVAVDAAGNLYLTDEDNAVIEEISAGGTLSVPVGTAGQYDQATAGPAAKSLLNNPRRDAVDAKGNVYFTDSETSGGYVGKLTP